MNKIAAIASFILISTCSAFSLFSQGKAKWVNNEYDFGSFPSSKEKVTGVMRFVNDGDSAISITSVRPTCGCTATRFTRESVAPGDSAEITVTYSSVGSIGHFRKAIHVYTDGLPSKTTVYVTGNVIPTEEELNARYPVAAGSLRVSSKSLPLGEITKGGNKMHYFRGYNSASEPIKVSFSNKPSNIEATAIPEVVPAGGLCTLSVYYSTAEVEKWGLVADSITVSSAPADSLSTLPAGSAHLEVLATIIDDFSSLTNEQMQEAPIARMDSTSIDFGEIRGNEKISRVFAVSNNGHNTLFIRSLQSFTSGIDASCEAQSIEPGASANVKVTVSPELFNCNILTATLNVTTNDPLHPKQTVRLVGQFIK